MPSGALTTVFDAIAESVADAVTALHDRTIATFQFVGRQGLSSVELLREAVGDIIEVIKWIMDNG